MMAAIAAANTSIKDTEITILERRDRIGRKILATGNGKCNLGNTDFSPKRDYRSHDPYRLPEFFARFQTSDTIRFFEERGLYLTEKNGYLYPYSGQASTVLDFFREELERKKVRIVCDCRIQKLCMQKSGWQVFTDQGQYHFDRLIISCGTAAGTAGRTATVHFGARRNTSQRSARYRQPDCSVCIQTVSLPSGVDCIAL